MSASSSFVVVGAGVSGLYAALLLARAGKRVRVVERRQRAGGLASAEYFRGVPCDLGSHRLHPAALERPLFREIHSQCALLSRPRRGLLLVGGARVPYPPSALSMARALGPAASAALALGLLRRRSRRAALASWEIDRRAPDDSSDVGFERFVTDRVGGRAYDVFYKPYAEKVWGLHPAELSQTVAKKRISSTRPLALFRSAVGRLASWLGGEREEGGDRYLYPAGGTSTIVAWLEARLVELGVRVELGAEWRVAHKNGETVLHSGDLADVVKTELEHRGLYLIYLALPAERLSRVETYYSPDSRYWFGRVCEIGNYSPQLRRSGESVLCVEIPEGVWGPGQDFAGARRDELLAQLVDAGIVPHGMAPIEARQLFVPSVYPLYRRGWQPRWNDAMARVADVGGVYPFGRQGLFLHVNLDHCADIASAVVEHVLAGGCPRTWIEHARRFVELRVRD